MQPEEMKELIEAHNFDAEPALRFTFGDYAYKLEIEQEMDSSFCNPRDNDNQCMIFGAHNRYSIGDVNLRNPLNRQEMIEEYGSQMMKGSLTPLWMYDHGATTVQAAESNPFNCPWDSGQVGWVFVTAEAEREFEKYNSPITVEQMKTIIQCEVEEYDKWMNGDVWSYTVTKEEGPATGDHSEGCGGYIGREWAVEDAVNTLQYIRKDSEEKTKIRAETMKTVTLVYEERNVNYIEVEVEVPKDADLTTLDFEDYKEEVFTAVQEFGWDSTDCIDSQVEFTEEKS